jgi:hypothetical protein
MNRELKIRLMKFVYYESMKRKLKIKPTFMSVG